MRWPAERERRAGLAEREEPRLLLVEEGVEAPRCEHCFEDWIRLPAADADVAVRMEALRLRALHHAGAHPALDADGVLRSGADWVSLPPVEARLMDALLARFGAVVRRDHLASAGWPDGAPGRNALDVHVLRLRRRIAPLDLVITTVRSRGYLLERSSSGNGQVHVREA